MIIYPDDNAFEFNAFGQSIFATSPKNFGKPKVKHARKDSRIKKSNSKIFCGRKISWFN